MVWLLIFFMLTGYTTALLPPTQPIISPQPISPILPPVIQTLPTLFNKFVDNVKRNNYVPEAKATEPEAQKYEYPSALRTSVPIVGIPSPSRSVESNFLDRIYDISNPDSQQPVEVDRLNSLINRLGRELQLLNEKSREILYEKIRGVTQIKKLRDGLKFAYTDMYNIQTSLLAYQQQLKELQDYLRANRSRIVVVDSSRLGQLYNLVQSLQFVAENMIAPNKKAAK